MLDADTNTLTIDNLIVRKILSVYELVVNKISATNGSLWVSNAGKVETAYKISVASTSTVSLPFSDIDTTPQVFDDYTNTYFIKDDVVTSDTFTINSLLISEELTTEILSSKKLILNSNNVRKFLYLYYNYYGGNFFLIKLDEERRNILVEVEALKSKRNQVSSEIPKLKILKVLLSFFSKSNLNRFTHPHFSLSPTP